MTIVRLPSISSILPGMCSNIDSLCIAIVSHVNNMLCAPLAILIVVGSLLRLIIELQEVVEVPVAGVLINLGEIETLME